ncbi:MAG: aminotransferase class V-fold PLP-dependent enzyme [Caldilineaceae bacterium]|nr:aminotransferase class V-fold PLP-dependent enzyme [Caldilineaceae bacterium]
MTREIYLDYAATTPVDPRVIEKMVQFLGPDGVFGNPSSILHRQGLEANNAVEQSRQQVAKLINAEPDEIIWTSGGTESDNLAIKGVALLNAHRGRHIITSEIEHKAVLDSCLYLETQGFHVTYIRPDAEGLITPEQVETALRPDTILVSLMHVNNEIGTITDIKSIAEITKDRGVLFHADATQSAARLPLDMKIIPADFVSISAHKMYGPKGIGVLYARRNPRIRLQPQIHGGGHERGIRSGTLPTHQIVGMGEAARLVAHRRAEDSERTRIMSQGLLHRLMTIERAAVNGNRKHCIDAIVNVSIPFVESESLLMLLPNIAISNGSACTSASVEPSHVLTALGVDAETAFSSLRFSIGRFTTEEEIHQSAKQVAEAVHELRRLSPLNR